MAASCSISMSVTTDIQTTTCRASTGDIAVHVERDRYRRQGVTGLCRRDRAMGSLDEADLLDPKFR